MLDLARAMHYLIIDTIVAYNERYLGTMSDYAFSRPLGKIIHGGDYNPEQWLDRPDILEKDIRYMKEAGINEATLGVFSWAMYEPREGEFHFDWLKNIMDNLYENGISTILATPSGARPVWLDHKYPEVMRVDGMGRRNRHGFRHNHCMSSEIFRDKVSIIDGKLAETFGDHPGLLAWHISNEFGGQCFCDLCRDKFRTYLRKRFNDDIELLNHEWWTAFWSARYSDFSEIEPPYDNGQTAVMGLNLEWKRFTTWNFSDFLLSEIKAVRDASPDPDIFVTTNFMKRYYDIDYRVLARDIDVISWDSYPAFHNDYESYEDTMLESAFDHEIMRGMKKDRPFLLMESAPGQVNWMPFNKLKRSYVHEQFAIQAIACGSDSVQYFQWRRSRGAAEQFHGAVIDHLGTNDTRVFRDVAHVGKILDRLSSVEGSVKKSDVAIIFEWDNWWAIDGSGGFSSETKKYDITCQDYWKALMRFGVEADIISVTDQFEDYRLILAPMLFLIKPETAQKLKDFVNNGGVVLGTYMTGYVNENCLCYEGGFPGAGLKDLFGIISEEIDTLYPSDRNSIRLEGGPADGRDLTVKDYAEILRTDNVAVIGRYTDDFYAKTPAVTCNDFGKGKAFYQAARINPEDMSPLLCRLLKEADVKMCDLPAGVEYHKRYKADRMYEFFLNLSDDTVMLHGIGGTDMLTGQDINEPVTLHSHENMMIVSLISN